ncbi:MAG: hypothetical protein HY002_19810 [Candidatus Rokubacteria bacterium]|nr:hypothetical protein [Candidatus Rokubacteria bacterium]
MPRERTTKGLAKRIELTYYQRPHVFRRWWRWLALLAPTLAACWLVAMAALGDQRIYTSGPVVTAHRAFETQCERCHAEVPRPAPAVDASAVKKAVASAPPHAERRFFRPVSDGACLSCHDGAIHHETQTVELRCATCHREHKAGTTLVRITDRHCTVCHADLTTKSGPSKFERRVVSLAEHPEFAVFRKGLKDEAAIKLNHATHLKEGLPAGGGRRVTLGCVDCHRTDDAGRYMRPISYQAHCKQCHPLEAAPDLIAPHDKPEIVHAFLLASVVGREPPAAASPPTGPSEEQPAPSPGRRRGGAGAALPAVPIWLATFHGADLRGGTRAGAPVQLVQRQRGGVETPAEPAAPAEEPQGSAGRRRGGAPAPEAPPPAPGGGAAPGGGPGRAAVAEAVAQMERDLFFGRQGCPYCHTVERAEPLPRIVPTKIPARWLPHSAFDHRAHRPLACVACHDRTPKSVETADVLLPRIGVCRDCHREGRGARAGCVECHLYHDRAKERAPDGPLTVRQFTASGAGPAASPAKAP